MAYTTYSNVQSMFSQLGYINVNEYVPSDICYEILLHIDKKLNSDDINSKEFRQIIGVSQLVKKDLIPLLISVNTEQVLEIIIKILADVLTPIENMSTFGQFNEGNNGYSTLLRLNWLLSTNKNDFINLKAIRRIKKIILENLVKLSSHSQLCSNNSTTVIKDCLRLIRNILQAPNGEHQSFLLWILLSEKFDKIILKLIENSNRRQWMVYIIELIALIFKNQHVDQMEKEMRKQKVTKNSSEENESNTSSYQDCGTSSSFESVSDASNSDNSTECPSKKITLQEDTFKISIKKQDTSFINVFKGHSNLDIINKELDAVPDMKQSTSLNESKGLCVEQFKIPKERPKKKLYSIKSLHNVNTNVQKKKKINRRMKTSESMDHNFSIHMPSHFFLSHLLQKFIINFLEKGFNTLVNEFYNVELPSFNHHVDPSLYFWILTYFCRFCTIRKVDMKYIREIISFKLISFIVHEGFKISEKLLIAQRIKSYNINLQVRHMHLVIMCIKELIKLIEFYRKTSEHSSTHAELIYNLKNSNNKSLETITWAKDLIMIFVVFIRRYDCEIHTIDYFHDLITTNHLTFLLLNNFKNDWKLDACITLYINKFSAPDIMFKYGSVLQEYKKNKDIVNEAVLTMMNNVFQEDKNTTALTHPIIKENFLNIAKEKNILFERWINLFEAVIGRINLQSTVNPYVPNTNA